MKDKLKKGKENRIQRLPCSSLRRDQHLGNVAEFPQGLPLSSLAAVSSCVCLWASGDLIIAMD